MEGFLDTATQLCIDWGYWGLFLSAFVAGSIVPFSSEAVMVVLVRLGLDPAFCLLAAAGITLYLMELRRFCRRPMEGGVSYALR